MTSVKCGLNQWLDTMADAMREFASTSLGVESRAVSLVPDAESLKPGMAGACLELRDADQSIQVGVVSDKAGCRVLSGAFLGMEPEEAKELSGPDIADSMMEVVNIVAGMLKIRMADAMPELNLSLPVITDGKIEPAPEQEMGVWGMKINEVEIQIIVLRQCARLNDKGES